MFFEKIAVEAATGAGSDPQDNSVAVARAWTTRIFRAALALVEDPQMAEITAGTSASALVENLNRKLGVVPTRRQVEELALAHMAVAVELGRLSESWEGNAGEDDFVVADESPTSSSRKTPVIPEAEQRRIIELWRSA